MLEIAFVKTAIALAKKFWWVAVLLALAGGVWWIADTISDAREAQVEAEAKAERAEGRATRWKKSVDDQNAAVQVLADNLETLQASMAERDETFRRRWTETNRLVRQNNQEADVLIATPPAVTEEAAVEDAKEALKQTAGFEYLEPDNAE